MLSPLPDVAIVAAIASTRALFDHLRIHLAPMPATSPLTLASADASCPAKKRLLYPFIAHAVAKNSLNGFYTGMLTDQAQML